MATRSKFPVYRGEKPYIFISYAHDDSELALSVAEELNRRNYRVWYDEGIEAGMKWPEYIATHLFRAALVMFFPSKKFNGSHNCEREVNFSVDMKKPMICVSLDDSELPPGLKMQLSTSACVPASARAAETVDRLISSGALSEELIGDGVEGYAVENGRAKRRFNASLFFGIVGVVLALGFGFALLGYMQGWFGEKSGLQKDSITITQSGDESGDQNAEITMWTSQVSRDLFLSQVSGDALYCCGNSFVSTRAAIEYKNGEFLVGGKAMQRGDISELDVIAGHTNLIELSLCYESITDISALSGLGSLTYLDLSGNEISDIAPLTNLAQLSTLKLMHTQAADLTPLLSMTSLKKLYVSYDMVDSIADILAGDFEVVVTE